MDQRETQFREKNEKILNLLSRLEGQILFLRKNKGVFVSEEIQGKLQISQQATEQELLLRAIHKWEYSLIQKFKSRNVQLEQRNLPKNKNLHEAAIKGSIMDCKLLVYLGHNPLSMASVQVMVGDDNSRHKVKNLSPLAISIFKGNLEIMDFFLNLPSMGIDAKDELGRTALHYSCETDFQGLTKHLIVSGANVNSQD